MKPLIWLCLAFSMISLSACVVAPYGGYGYNRGYYNGYSGGYSGGYYRDGGYYRR